MTGVGAGRRGIVGLAVGLIVVSACSGGGRRAAPRPPRPAVVTVSMREYRFEHQPAIAPGRAVFRVANAGGIDHQLVLVRLPDDLPGTLDEQLHSATRRPVETIYQFGFRPGDAAVFAADLPAGHYGFVCFLQDPDGTPHALKGMSSDLWVRASPNGGSTTPTSAQSSTTTAR